MGLHFHQHQRLFEIFRLPNTLLGRSWFPKILFIGRQGSIVQNSPLCLNSDNSAKAEIWTHPQAGEMLINRYDKHAITAADWTREWLLCQQLVRICIQLLFWLHSVPPTGQVSYDGSQRSKEVKAVGSSVSASSLTDEMSLKTFGAFFCDTYWAKAPLPEWICVSRPPFSISTASTLQAAERKRKKREAVERNASDRRAALAVCPALQRARRRE